MSWQCKVIDILHPTVTKGAYIDDRNFRGTLSEILEVDACVHGFDKLALHEREHDKSIFLCTNNKDRQKIRRMTLHGLKPKSPTHTEIVGHTITVARRAICANNDKRTKCGKAVAKRTLNAPLHRGKKVKATIGKTIPTSSYATHWTGPSPAAIKGIKKAILDCVGHKQQTEMR